MKRSIYTRQKRKNIIRNLFLVFFIALFSVALPILEYQQHKDKIDLFENEDESRKENTEVEDGKFEVKESKSDFGNGVSSAICNCRTSKTLLGYNLPQFKINLINRSQLPAYILYCKLLLEFY